MVFGPCSRGRGGIEEIDLRKNVDENSSDLKQIIHGEPGMKGAEEGWLSFVQELWELMAPRTVFT